MSGYAFANLAPIGRLARPDLAQALLPAASAIRRGCMPLSSDFMRSKASRLWTKQRFCQSPVATPAAIETSCVFQADMLRALVLRGGNMTIAGSLLGLLLAGPTGAAAGLGLSLFTDGLIQKRSDGKHLLNADMARFEWERIDWVRVYSAPLMHPHSRVLNPVITAANVLLAPIRFITNEGSIMNAEHHFVVVRTESAFFCLQKCHDGCLRFEAYPTLDACLEMGVVCSGSSAPLNTVELELEIDYTDARDVQFMRLCNWFSEQEPAYVLKSGNCQHFAMSLIDWACNELKRASHGAATAAFAAVHETSSSRGIELEPVHAQMQQM